jgi:hypothetical protein
MYIYTPRLCGPSSCTAIKRDTITLYGQAGQHYESSCGVAVFEAGSHTTYFDVNIVDDDSWEPIRSFVVGLLRSFVVGLLCAPLWSASSASSAERP